MYDYVVYRGRCEREKWVREQASDYQLMTKHHSRWEKFKEPVKSDPQYDLFMLFSVPITADHQP